MFCPPDHHHNLSQRLSRVFDEIGVNKNTVMTKRRMHMLMETLDSLNFQIKGQNISFYRFGSQIEGSTTCGLRSDVDTLLCFNDWRVIQDWSDWQPGMCQLLIIQDKTVSPGYCLLQLVNSDLPLPVMDVQHEIYKKDNRGRVLLRHASCFPDIVEGTRRHGPAVSSHRKPLSCEQDIVNGIHCLSWPKEAEPWLQQQHSSGWPTEDMKRYSAKNGCFVVPVGSKTGEYVDLEWRISTSHSERCLMFSLNITQIRCYILMKMILKTFLKPRCEEAVSSFMCKNILFHCIADSEANSVCNESTLMLLLNKCLQALFHCILTQNCPHFVISGNNLLAGKLSSKVKHGLAEVMCASTANIEHSLLSITIDDLGNRLQLNLCRISEEVHFKSTYENSAQSACSDIVNAGRYLLMSAESIQSKLCTNADSVDKNLVGIVFKLYNLYLTGSTMDKVASSLLTPYFCTNIGSILATEAIHRSHEISPEALTWFSLGLNFDFSSSRLKLASSLCCAGDLERCEIVLATLQSKLSHTPFSTQCSCYLQLLTVREDFCRLTYEKNEDVIKNNMAFCVTYRPCEDNCIPHELKYEMYRSTADDRQYRDEDDYWMDWAVVDSIPFLYFLQYKVYHQLHRPLEQQRALRNLVKTIITEPNLGHKETAWNLLGQCMEQRGRIKMALRCYMSSMIVRRRNNAAKWHVCKLLAHLFGQRT